MTSPRAVPGIGRDLSVPEALACALRILAHEGWQENLSGHITWADDTGEALWVNPWGMWWSEVRARDIMRVSLDGSVLSGKWDVTPVVFIHTELHRARPDARIVVHNHPVRRDRALVSRRRAGDLAPERVPLRRRARVRRRVRRHRSSRPRPAKLARRAGRQGDRRAAREPRRDHHRRDRSAPRATARSPSSACAASRSTRCKPDASCGRCRGRPRRAEGAAEPGHARRVLGRRGAPTPRPRARRSRLS